MRVANYSTVALLAEAKDCSTVIMLLKYKFFDLNTKLEVQIQYVSVQSVAHQKAN
jgi:hypothetical protein